MARRLLQIASAALLLALVPAGSAAAAELHTSPTGSDSASCSASDPCSLHKAFSGPGPGDEIIVGPGTYNQTTSLLTSVPISFHGAAGQPRPLILTNQPIALFNAASTASDLEIRSTVGGTANAFQMDGTAVDRVVVRATPASGSFVSTCAFQGEATIRDVVCWGKGSGGQVDALNTGSAGSADRTSVLRNVTAVVTGDTSGYGIYAGAQNGKKHTLRIFNTIARHPDPVGRDIMVAAESGGMVDGRTSHSNYDRPYLFGAGAALVDDTPRQTAAPAFVDLANGDLHQAPGSPTIDAGLNDAANGPTDADRVVRTVNGTTDIGAFEQTLAPTAATGAATSNDPFKATLTGTVNPNGLPTSYRFDYGRTTEYSHSATAVELAAGADPVAATTNVDGLDPKALYHYRLVATNAKGETLGADATFTTPPLAFAGVRFVTKRGRVKKGRVPFKLSCADLSTLTRCTGTLRLRKKVTLRRGGRRVRRTVTLGRASFAIPAGARRTVRVKLTRAGRVLARRKLRATGRASAVDARGGTALPRSAKVTVLPAKKKKR